MNTHGSRQCRELLIRDDYITWYTSVDLPVRARCPLPAVVAEQRHVLHYYLMAYCLFRKEISIKYLDIPRSAIYELWWQNRQCQRVAADNLKSKRTRTRTTTTFIYKIETTIHAQMASNTKSILWLSGVYRASWPARCCCCRYKSVVGLLFRFLLFSIFCFWHSALAVHRGNECSPSWTWFIIIPMNFRVCFFPPLPFFIFRVQRFVWCVC